MEKGSWQALQKWGLRSWRGKPHRNFVLLPCDKDHTTTRGGKKEEGCETLEKKVIPEKKKGSGSKRRRPFSDWCERVPHTGRSKPGKEPRRRKEKTRRRDSNQ